MGQNFSASVSDSDIFCPITCIFFARTSCRSKAMSSSVTVGLMTLCRVTCCPCAVATTMPATNAPANPAAPVILHFMIILLTLVLLPQRTTENSNSECMLIQLGCQWISNQGMAKSAPSFIQGSAPHHFLQLLGIPSALHCEL